MLKGGSATSLFSCQLRIFCTDLLSIHRLVVAGIRLVLAVIHSHTCPIFAKLLDGNRFFISRCFSSEKLQSSF